MAQQFVLTGQTERGSLESVVTKRMNAMERCRQRLRLLLDDRTPGGKIKQKTFADYMDKSEAWLTNVLHGKRGIRIVDLDKVADFFRLPVSEFVRENDSDLVEVTPTEKILLRRIRRMSQDYRDSVLTIAGMTINRTDGPGLGHNDKHK
jgi:transcriptional regulator with XRE-family HTH domain